MKKTKATGTRCICTVCEKRFVSKRGVPLYCSKACSQKAYRLRHGQAEDSDKKNASMGRTGALDHCDNCQRVFCQSGVGRRAKFCSDNCRAIYDQKKQAAAYRWQNEQYKSGNPHEFVTPEKWWNAKPAARYKFIEDAGFVYVHSCHAFLMPQSILL